MFYLVDYVAEYMCQPLTGVYCRADRNQMAAMFAIGQDKEPIPQLPGKFSRDMVSFYNACLTRCPDSRPSASDFLRHHPFVVNRRKMP